MKLKLISAAVALTLALPATAQETAAVASTMASIQVSGHYDNSVGTSDAASQGVVTAALIANRPALRPGELLEFVPGVIVTQHSGDGKANQYFLRGYNLDHGTDFATYVDGMPVNMRTHAHGQGYTDLNFLIPELVDRIQYKKGTYYADEGDFASAGAAHLALAGKVKEGSATITQGEHGYLRGLVVNSSPLADGNLLYALELAHNDGPWSTPEAFRKQAGVLRYSAGGADSRFSITGMAYRGGWRATSQIPQRAVDSGAMGAFDAVDPSDGGRTARYSLSAELARRSSDSQFRASAYAVRSDLTLFGNYTYFLDDPVNGDQARQTERRRMLGFDVMQAWLAKAGDIDISNRLGLQVRHDHIAPLALYATARQHILRTVTQSAVDEGSAGLWFDNTLQWTPWLRTVAGLRYDRYRFDVDSSLAANSGKADAHIASPKLTAVLGPWKKTELFANYGKGFHSNDARGTVLHVTPRELEPADPVTPLVRTSGAEMGLRTDWAHGLQSSLALWKLRSGSELVFSGDAGDTAPSRASRRSGVELNNHYIASNWLLFDLDLALSRARYTQDDPAGNWIPGAVEKVASFGATVTEWGPWSGAFQLRYFGPRPLIEDNSRRSASTTTAYLRAAYRLERRWKLSLDIFNLFNRKGNDIDYYYTSRLPGEPAEGVAGYHFHPAEPRTWRLTLKAGF